MVAMALLLAAGAPAVADDSLLARCWPAEALIQRPGENLPMRGAPGAAAGVPRFTLATRAPSPEGRLGVVRRVELPKGVKLVALTLDLCEQPGEVAGYDGPIVDYLRAKRIKATFFAGGKWMVTHGERTEQLMADPLFQLANHGWAHRNLRGLAGADLMREVQGPQAAYERARATLATRQCVASAPRSLARVPTRLTLFRFPFGGCNPEALQAVAANGLVPIQWDVSTGDPSPGQSARAIADMMLRNVRPGSIVLVHANGRGHHTAEALPIAIPQLEARGYRFVTVAELLAAGKPVVSDTCYDSRPGDTDRYDALFAKRPLDARGAAAASGATGGGLSGGAPDANPGARR